MAVDIRIQSEFPIQWRLSSLFKKQILGLLQILLVVNQCIATPIWMPQFLSGGQGRNIRHLPCVSRRTGEQGTCMFAYTCMKSNGTHLGTCIDRFYFGSCCKIDNNELLGEENIPQIINNQVTTDDVKQAEPSNSDIITKPVKNSDTSNLGFSSSTAKPITTSTTERSTSILTTQKVQTTTEKIYVPIITSTKPNKTQSPSTTKRPEVPTTQQYFLSTFQVVHDTDQTTASPTTTTTKTWTQVKQNTTSSGIEKTNSTTPTPIKTTTKKPVKPIKTTTTRKPPIKKPTPKPPTKPTTTVKPTTAKPVVPTKKPVSPTKKPIVTTKPQTTKPTVQTTTIQTTTVRASPTITTRKPPPTTTTTTTTVRPIKTTTKQTPTNIKTTTKNTPVILKSTTTTTTTKPETTSEVVFTKPGPTDFGITTFRPDLSPTTSKPFVPPLTTFSYLSEGEKETTTKVTPTKETASTVGNEIPSEKPIDNISEALEENNNVIFQQIGTEKPTISSTASSTTDTSSDSSVPFFPDKTGTTKVPWVEITQSTGETSASSIETSTSVQTTTEVISSTESYFGALNSSDYRQVCGRRLYPEARVVGGEKSTFGKWPWQISLRQWRTSTYLHKCGAALLNENWAITAAHCVENVPPSDLLLRLGEHDLSTEDEPFGFQERRVQIVASHPQFDPRTFEYDLALLRFYEPVKFQPNIIPVCVPEDSTNFVGQTAHVTGWGRLYEDGPLPSVLQEVSVPVINNTLCENMYRSAGYIEHIPEIFICAGWRKGGFDSCEGDSGGPMVIQRPDKRWLLAGVISWGIGCAEPNQPGVYTRISEFREWIHQILQF